MNERWGKWKRNQKWKSRMRWERETEEKKMCTQTQQCLSTGKTNTVDLVKRRKRRCYTTHTHGRRNDGRKSTHRFWAVEWNAHWKMYLCIVMLLLLFLPYFVFVNSLSSLVCCDSTETKSIHTTTCVPILWTRSVFASSMICVCGVFRMFLWSFLYSRSS